MCGIAGYIGKKKYFPNKKKIVSCKLSLKRRGPDSSGLYTKNSNENSLLFIHTRLSIIDLNKSASQPFSDEKGSIIFNGMIYNYIELKNDLEKKGQKFQTQSDTEVLLKMMNLYKEKTFEKLDGMWSIAYFNFNDEEVILSRDRFGEKPLFYSIENNNLLFSNSIKALNKLSRNKLKLNNNKVKKFLSFPDKTYGLDDETYFKNIFQFPKSSYAKFNLKKIKLKFRKYWSLKIKNNKYSFYDACKKIKKITKTTIRTRVRSDVPNSVLISGGLDSNTIISQASKISKINGYSLLSNSPDYDERIQIKSSEKLNKFKTNFIPSKNSSSLRLLEKIVDYGFNPLLTPTGLALGLICNKINKDKNKVLLTGIGGDELFCGYYVNFLSHILSYKNKKLHKEKYLFWDNKIKKYIRNPKLKNFEINKKQLNRLNFFIEENSVITNCIKNYKKIKINKMNNDIFYNNMLQNIFIQSIPSQVFQSDYVSMYFSIENRSPFLSKDLFDFIYKLNKNFFMHKGVPKAMLRKSMKGCFPKMIIDNYEKTGFYSPFRSFFKKQDISKIKNYLLNSKCLKKNLKMKSFENLFSQSNILHSESKFIFACLNIAILEKVSNS